MAVFCGHCKRHHATPFDVYQCSRNARGSQRRMQSSSIHLAGSSNPFTAPASMIEAIREGRYAVDIGKGKQHYIFLRISRPTKGRLAGCLKIQTQHSERYKEAAIRYPSQTWRIFTNYRDDLDQALKMICVNPLDAAMLYAQEKGACSRCGKELTDERSRYYSIGPECEKHWPDLITKINEVRGPWNG